MTEQTEPSSSDDVKQDEADADGPPARRSVRIAAVVFSIVFTLVLAEVAVRIAGLGYGHAPMVSSPLFHHWHESNYDYVVWGPYDQFGGHDNHFNGEGFTMSAELPAADTPSLVVLGDSFTEGIQVQESERFVTLLAEKRQLSGLNFGCSSFSPLLSRLLLEHYADRVSPRVVLLQLYVNDIGDDIKYAKLGTREGDRITAVPSDDVSLAVRLARRSHLARVLRKMWMMRKYRNEMELRNDGRWGADAWDPYFTKPIAEAYSQAELATTVSNIEELAAQCQEPCRFYLFAIPDRGSLKHGTEDYFHAYFATFAKEHGIGFIDVRTAFQAHPVAELFFPMDIHLTKKGHQILADALDAGIAKSE